jgi:hypothetical protein
MQYHNRSDAKSNRTATATAEMPTMVETQGTEGMSTTSGPQQQHEY